MTSILSAKQRDRSPTAGSDCGGPHSNLFEYGGGPSRSPASSLLVILHYLLKNNIEDFNTRCDKNQLSGPLGFLPSLLGGSPANGRIVDEN